jgi:hypothetical protein
MDSTVTGPPGAIPKLILGALFTKRIQRMLERTHASKFNTGTRIGSKLGGQQMYVHVSIKQTCSNSKLHSVSCSYHLIRVLAAAANKIVTFTNFHHLKLANLARIIQALSLGIQTHPASDFLQLLAACQKTNFHQFSPSQDSDRSTNELPTSALALTYYQKCF